MLHQLTSILTASTLSMCLLKMCLRTKSGPLNFFPLSGQSHLSFASSWVFASTNLFVSVNIVKKQHIGHRNKQVTSITAKHNSTTRNVKMTTTIRTYPVDLLPSPSLYPGQRRQFTLDTWDKIKLWIVILGIIYKKIQISCIQEMICWNFAMKIIQLLIKLFFRTYNKITLVNILANRNTIT